MQMPRARNTGFTFFELLLVVSIVGVLAAMVAPPRAGTFRRGGIESAASDVAVMVRPARHDNPVVLMAGGLGKRLRPLTEERPKPMLMIGNRPILLQMRVFEGNKIARNVSGLEKLARGKVTKNPLIDPRAPLFKLEAVAEEGGNE